MDNAAYLDRRGQLETYFDRTAADAWAKLTSDAPVSGIRATVRAGRDRMRAQLLGWLPEDLSGARVLDAGCGPGQLSIEAARRGAEVVAVDLSPTLLKLAEERLSSDPASRRITFTAGDMLDPRHGSFDYVVAMDSLIHYPAADIARSVAGLAGRTSEAVLFTHAPRTLMLSLMHKAGSLFPRGDKAPAIEPVAFGRLKRLFARDETLGEWDVARSGVVSSGFYISSAIELRRP
jgi:magnesium-protoporphyrin O-methyltransferase